MFLNLSAPSTRSVALALGVLVALATTFATVTRAQPQESGSPISTEISAPATDKQTGDVVGTFNGTLDIERFSVKKKKLYAFGTLTGDITKLDGTTTKEVTKPVKLPVISGTTGPGSESGTAQPQQQQQECDILHLTLGPLDLDLLGLQVHLDQVVLDIVAVPGAGNLLGNLLCAVAGLLDPEPPNPLDLIADLLNLILEILRGLQEPT